MCDHLVVQGVIDVNNKVDWKAYTTALKKTIMHYDDMYIEQNDSPITFLYCKTENQMHDFVLEMWKEYKAQLRTLVLVVQ